MPDEKIRSCEYCGSALENDGIFYGNEYGCGREEDSDYRPPLCYQEEIAALKAEIAQLKEQLEYWNIGEFSITRLSREAMDADIVTVKPEPDCLGERARKLAGEKPPGSND